MPRDYSKYQVGSSRQVPDIDTTIEDNLTVAGGIFDSADQVELISAATKTFDEGDSGVIQRAVITTVITLPATVVGTTYVVENGGEDGTVTVTVSPAAADKIMGNGFTSADNKDAINTLGNRGDRIVLVGDGVNGWFCQLVRGTWTREA